MIGFFDSGFGGLTIMRAAVRVLPEYDYLYLGDNARAPYGGRSSKEILRFTIEAVEYLFSAGCMLIVVACNTASAEALRRVQQDYLPRRVPGRRVLGIVRPSAEEIARRRFRSVGIMATEGVVASNIYGEELSVLAPCVKVFQQACPGLVPLVESGRAGDPEAERLVAEYLDMLISRGPSLDAVLLACTHFPLLGDLFKKEAPPSVEILDQGAVVAVGLQDYLRRHPEIERHLGRQSRRSFVTTGAACHFNDLARRFYGESVESRHDGIGEIVSLLS
ncbi:MAG: glutamate racemase [Deltaproteobacteria bacterium]|nr:glutamate racemase [Deltaproteobacteria bacterium]